MSPTKRFVFIIGLGVFLLIPVVFLGIGLQVFLLYNLLCFGLLIVDRYLSPSKDKIQIARQSLEVLYFKTENQIDLLVTNQYHRSLHIEVKDMIPDFHFNVLSQHMAARVPAFGQCVYSYTVLPTKRGSFLFPEIFVRYKGVLGLCTNSFSIPLPMDYKVYPNVTDISKYRLMLHKNRSLASGGRPIARMGADTEFESLREYVYGDDYRKINWLATARESKLIVNQYEQEKNQPVFILIDTGRPMSHPIRGYKKLDYAINAALVLSDIVNQKGDLSGLMVFDTEINSVIMPGKGAKHRSAFMDSLYHANDTKNAADFEGAFKFLTTKFLRRGLVFLFTDFETMDEAEQLLESAKILKKRFILIIVLIKSDSIHALAEHPATCEREIYEKAVAIDMLYERKKIIKALLKNGAFCLESPSERFAIHVVNQYLSIKNGAM